MRQWDLFFMDVSTDQSQPRWSTVYIIKCSRLHLNETARTAEFWPSTYVSDSVSLIECDGVSTYLEGETRREARYTKWYRIRKVFLSYRCKQPQLNIMDSSRSLSNLLTDCMRVSNCEFEAIEIWVQILIPQQSDHTAQIKLWGYVCPILVRTENVHRFPGKARKIRTVINI